MSIAFSDICNFPSINISTSTGRLGWIPDPDCGRSTIGIVNSCLFTSLLCIWSSLHMPVSKSNDTRGKIHLRTFRWVMLAIFAPESVAAYAIGEFYQARILKKYLESKHECYWPWKFCFLAIAGGIVVVDVEDDERVLRFNNDFDAEVNRNGSLTVQNLRDLPANCERVLEDKTKTGPCIKLVTLIQILWFAAQLTGRYFQSKLKAQSTTTLEIMTAGFILCGAIQYGFWFEKPQGVIYPIVVKCTSVITDDHPEAVLDAQHPSGANSTEKGSAIVGHSRTLGEDEGTTSTAIEKSTPTTPLVVRTPDTINRPIITIGSKFVSLDSSHPKSKRTIAERFRTFSKTVAGIPNIFKLQQGETKSSTFRKKMNSFLRMYELPQDKRFSSEQIQLFLLSAITTTAFAGLNMAAWNFHFPTEIEAYLWKVSSVMILVLPTAFAILAFLVEEVPVPHVVLSLIGVAYGIVRAYIIVECFIGLRSEPAEVYCSLNWASYFPHV